MKRKGLRFLLTVILLAVMVFSTTLPAVASWVYFRHTSLSARIHSFERTVSQHHVGQGKANRSREVSILQAGNNRLGYTSTTVDGIFGPETETRIRLLQEGFGITIDGQAGANTWLRMSWAFGVGYNDIALDYKW